MGGLGIPIASLSAESAFVSSVGATFNLQPNLIPRSGFTTARSKSLGISVGCEVGRPTTPIPSKDNDGRPRIIDGASLARTKSSKFETIRRRSELEEIGATVLTRTNAFNCLS
jgi:hypothetical protein